MALGTPSLALSDNESTDVTEQQTFGFFRVHTTKWMTGYFVDPVWERTVLQVCHTEPAIRHAVNALGALHKECFWRSGKYDAGGSDSLVRSNFPFSQYAKALRGLQRLVNSPNTSADVILLGALLSIHFESLQERFIPVLIHMENAIKLILLVLRTKSQRIELNLLRTFMRLDLQGSTYIGMRVPSLAFIITADNVLPTAFLDLTQARDICNTWTSRLYHFMRTVADQHKFVSPGFVPLEILSQAQEIEHTFLTIDGMLWKFMQKPGLKLTLREQHGLAMLRVQAKEFRIVAAGCLYTEASLYDRYLSDFEEIYTICKVVMDGQDSSNCVLSVSTDWIPLRTLWFVATHCRESWLRHSAVSLLRTLLADNDVWHVEALIKSAEVCIAKEEEACGVRNKMCRDVPEWKRVHSSGFDQWTLGARPRNRVTARFRIRGNGMDGEWTDELEVIEW